MKNSSCLWIILSQQTNIVRGKFPGDKIITHMETRLGQNPHFREPSTRDLPHHEPYLSWNSSMSVIIFRFFDSSAAYADFSFQAGMMTIKL